MFTMNFRKRVCDSRPLAWPKRQKHHESEDGADHFYGLDALPASLSLPSAREPKRQKRQESGDEAGNFQERDLSSALRSPPPAPRKHKRQKRHGSEQEADDVRELDSLSALRISPSAPRGPKLQKRHESEDEAGDDSLPAGARDDLPEPDLPSAFHALPSAREQGSEDGAGNIRGQGFWSAYRILPSVPGEHGRQTRQGGEDGAGAGDETGGEDGATYEYEPIDHLPDTPQVLDFLPGASHWTVHDARAFALNPPAATRQHWVTLPCGHHRLLTLPAVSILPSPPSPFPPQGGRG